MRSTPTGLRSRLAGLLALCLAPLLAAQVLPESRGGFVYRLRLEPESPLEGSILLLSLEIEGLDRARLEALALDEGLVLESSRLQPLVDAGGRRGSELRLELRVLKAGFRRVEGLRVEGAEGRLELGPFGFEARKPTAAGRAAPSYRWVAPARVLRYAAFPLRLEALAGSESAGSAAAGNAVAAGSSAAAGNAPLSFPLPEGLVLEALGGGAEPEGHAWLATALEAGEILLPAAELEGGRAEALSLRVLPLPAAIEESRAQGDFELSLEGPERAQAGDRLFFRLLLSGRGNQPSLRFPSVELRLDGKLLPAAAIDSRRSDALRPGPRAYEGSSILELSFLAPGPGLLSFRVSPLPVLGSDGQLRRLGLPPYELRVEAKAESAGPEKGAGLLLELAAEAALRLSALESARAAPSLLAAGESEELLALLAELPPSEPAREGGRREDAALLEAAARWQRGEKGRALALLLDLARRGGKRKAFQAAALEASESLGAGPPLLDRLPEPGLALALGLSALAASAFAFFCSPRAKKAAPRGALLLLGILLLALGLGGGLLGAASLAERRREYAVAWTERLLSVPSEKAEGGLSLQRGQSGLVIGRAPGYVGLRLPDGSVGWVAHNFVYSY